MSSLILILVFSILLLVRAAQLLFVSGSVRSKNAAAVCVRLIIDLAIASLTLWAIGGAFIPGTSDRYITWSHLLGIGATSWTVYTVLPLILIATAATHGATAERTRLLPMLLFTFLAAIFIPILFQLSQRTGSPDSGIGLAATFGGAAALAAAIQVGSRKGKFNRDLSVNFVPGHNLLMQWTGVMMMTIAFIAISRDISTLLAMSSATLVGAAYGRIKFGKVDTGLIAAAALGGLCAGGVGVGPQWVAVIMGGLVGLIVPIAVIAVEVRLRVDDVTASASTHLIGGFIGLIIASICTFLTAPTWSAWVLAWMGLAILSPLIGAVLATCVCVVCKTMNQLRISEGDEFDGTDLSELDVNGYPDFQQTMIKSYHLREL